MPRTLPAARRCPLGDGRAAAGSGAAWEAAGSEGTGGAAARGLRARGSRAGRQGGHRRGGWLPSSACEAEKCLAAFRKKKKSTVSLILQRYRVFHHAV